MSYRVVHTPTGNTVHYDHTAAGCWKYIHDQLHPSEYTVEDND